MGFVLASHARHCYQVACVISTALGALPDESPQRSMSDRFFFPAAGLLAGLLVLAAMAPGFNKLPSGPVSGGGTDYSRIEVKGKQLNRMIAGGESDIELVKVEGKTVLRIGVLAGTLSEEPLRGPYFILAQDLEVAYAGRPVRVTVRARAADKYGAEGLRLNYSTGNGTGSGWQRFDLTRQFRDISFVYELPPRNEGSDPGYDYIAIRPEVPEKQRAVFIESLVLEPLAPASSGDAE